MYSKGDLVVVRGFGGREAILRVWEVRPKGCMVCTEEGFQARLRGGEAPMVGFPLCDIIGLADKGEQLEGYSKV